MRAQAVVAIALVCACVWSPTDALRSFSGALADWASIVLAALPYIVVGALAARFSRRLFERRWRHEHLAIALLSVLNPGCDCALNGFAGALARLRPAHAGFALTFAAAASPVSLAVTYAAFGMHMTITRAAGALLAAALTSAAWTLLSVVPTFTVGQPPDFVVGRASLAQKHEVERCSPYYNKGRPPYSVVERARLAHWVSAAHPTTNTASDLAAALSGVTYAATAAVAIKLFAPAALFAHVAPAGAAVLGALLSPCSTADPLMAAAFIRDSHAQLAFMFAAQSLDVRQLLLLLRHFGVSRTVAAAVCAASACAIAMKFA